MRHREAVAARVGRRWAPIGKDEECHVRHINHMESGGHISKRHKNERRTADVADKKERAPGGDEYIQHSSAAGAGGFAWPYQQLLRKMIRAEWLALQGVSGEWDACG